ncbi:MAG TPA: hypothetical protein PKY81_14160 [bacterium]|nr:hypothetical protein [bacterium]HPN32091.1 hypothetical protein [bacterium]
MQKKRDYLLKYWMRYYLNIDELGDVTIRTEFVSKKYPDIKYDISLLNDEKLVILAPARPANKLLKKYPEILSEESNSDEGIQLSFNEDKLDELAGDFKIVEKKFPPDKELVERFLNYHNKKIELKKKRKKYYKKAGN